MREPWINATRRLTARLGPGPQKGDKLDLTMFAIVAVLWALCVFIGVIVGDIVLRSNQDGVEWAFLYLPLLPGFYALQREYRPNPDHFGMTARYLTSPRTWLWSLISLIIVIPFRLIPSPSKTAYHRLAKMEAQLCAHWLAFVIFGVLLGPAVEEFIFRGYLYLMLRQNIGDRMAALLSSAAFGILHGLHGLAAPSAFIYALVEIYIDNRAASLVPSLVGHIVWNGTLLLLCRPQPH